MAIQPCFLFSPLLYSSYSFPPQKKTNDWESSRIMLNNNNNKEKHFNMHDKLLGNWVIGTREGSQCF
jgi:hypothetical protein